MAEQITQKHRTKSPLALATSSELIENWRTQVRKGYLEMCILLMIQRCKRIYGFDLLEKMSEIEISLKEGTLYPLLTRMTSDGLLASTWETDGVKGHPRKFYSLTKSGARALEEMQSEFEKMVERYILIQKQGVKNGTRSAGE